MKIEFKKRNEEGLHCRFCKTSRDKYFTPILFETSPIKGIVCNDCKYHLDNYLDGFQKL